MIAARAPTLFASTGAARQACMRTSSRQITRTNGRRQYGQNVDAAAQVASSTSKLPWIVAGGALTAGGAYYFLQPQASESQSAQHESTGQKIKKQVKKDWYADDHPKPVEDRHGDSVTKHSIAAEKNQYKTRKGVFSKEEFDNHVLEHKDPAKDFEKKQ